MRKTTITVAGVLSVVALTLSACGGSTTSSGPDDGASGQATTTTGPIAAPPTTVPTPTTVPPPPPPPTPITVLVVGDSVMTQIAGALETWSEAHPDELRVVSDAHIGCGTTRYGLKRYEEGTGDNGAICATWADPVYGPTVADPNVISWVTSVQVYQPDVVVGRVSGWDTIDRLVPSIGNRWVRPGDPAYDAYVKSEYGEALDILSSTGADVAWLTSPYTNHPGPYNDPARMDRVTEIVGPLVDALPRHTTIDYRGFLGESGSPRDLEFRPDGDHLAPDRLGDVAAWLAPQLVAAGRANRATSR